MHMYVDWNKTNKPVHCTLSTLGYTCILYMYIHVCIYIYIYKYVSKSSWKYCIAVLNIEVWWQSNMYILWDIEKWHKIYFLCVYSLLLNTCIFCVIDVFACSLGMEPKRYVYVYTCMDADSMCMYMCIGELHVYMCCAGVQWMVTCRVHVHVV